MKGGFLKEEQKKLEDDIYLLEKYSKMWDKFIKDGESIKQAHGMALILLSYAYSGKEVLSRNELSHYIKILEYKVMKISGVIK